MKSVSCPRSLLLLLAGMLACTNPQPGPDKSIGGTVLGGAWGAGAGAAIGNQVSTAGLGAGAGAGFGAVAGLLTGIAYDRMESVLVEQQRELDDLSMRTRANFSALSGVQDTLDDKIANSSPTGIYQVFFDDDSTTLKAGAIANLQVIAESIKGSASANTIHVIGHTDDTGNQDHNKRLSESRAREVAAYLGSRGISMDHVKILSQGSERPIATNGTPQGRQLNRRVDIYIGR